MESDDCRFGGVNDRPHAFGDGSSDWRTPRVGSDAGDGGVDDGGGGGDVVV